MSRWSISPSTTLPSRITSMTRTPLGADHVSDWPRCSGISPPTRVLDRGSLKLPERPRKRGKPYSLASTSAIPIKPSLSPSADVSDWPRSLMRPAFRATWHPAPRRSSPVRGRHMPTGATSLRRPSLAFGDGSPGNVQGRSRRCARRRTCSTSRLRQSAARLLHFGPDQTSRQPHELRSETVPAVGPRSFNRTAAIVAGLLQGIARDAPRVVARRAGRAVHTTRR